MDWHQAAALVIAGLLGIGVVLLGMAYLSGDARQRVQLRRASLVLRSAALLAGPLFGGAVLAFDPYEVGTITIPLRLLGVVVIAVALVSAGLVMRRVGGIRLQ